ncbi:LPO_1073/Vpar_1526 family protein [Comamonas sp.]|uniref:LPO_1073/Vpar_1526 family protein n=1 Tax=Comamonas sp. TaxID=34028 RepID=UPI0028984AE4|nr:LPO_1073/Vpar_1526 family protein [Comamonas sp.]
MLGDKQEQLADTGSTAIQAGRDVHYHGLSVTEVRELCILFLRNNFPELREEARRTAEEHVKSFANALEQKLVNDAASIVLEKFREPDVQAAINDAVQASARKGAAANTNILSTLISERVAKGSNDYKDMVLSEAVHVVPKLTGRQIALLSFVHFVRSMVYRGLPHINELERVGRAAFTFSSPGFGLSESQKQHLQYAGAASVNNILGGDIFDIQRQEYEYFAIADGATFKAELSTNAPSYLRLLEQFTTDNLFAVSLTSVGQAIALANISNFLGKLDYTIWLK